MSRSSFYSKILLFGEYGSIKDSKALAIPYDFYKGMLIWGRSTKTSSEEESNKTLQEYYKFLKTSKNEQIVSAQFSLEQLEHDIEKGGMYFDSTIPQGYGIGSSGALVAAIYTKYATNKINVLEDLTKDKLLKLKAVFSAMESFFHGCSSGLDPLNSYLSIPLLINSQNNVEIIGLPEQTKDKGAIFLLDTGIVKKTASMVSIFMKQMNKQAFQNVVKNQFFKYTEACIEDFLKGDVMALLENTKQLSHVVFENFKPMIPEKIISIWKYGIDTGHYFLKLCGSGGGGYVIGFTEDFETTQKLLKDYKLQKIYSL